MTFGKPDAVKPHVRFDEGRGWDRKLTTTVCLTPRSQSRQLYQVFGQRVRNTTSRAIPSELDVLALVATHDWLLARAEDLNHR